MSTFDDIAHVLAGHKPHLLPVENRTSAAVALLLRDSPSGPQVLFIERAAHDHDPWSGNICFPGGKMEESDENPQIAAERETLEEIGVNLGKAQYLGRLSDVSGTAIPVHVACFIYHVEQAVPMTLSEEVQDAFWVSLAELRNPTRHGEATVHFAGHTLQRPAFRFAQPGRPALWGLTYQLILQFLELLRNSKG